MARSPADPRRTVETARSLLFVPADRPDRFATAEAAGADAVILDLEDAVAPSGKSAGREAAAEWLQHRHESLVRLSSNDPDAMAVDLEALRGTTPVGFVIPKVESARTVAEIVAYLPKKTAVVPLIESAAGLLAATAIAASPGVARLALGSVDLEAETGLRLSAAEISQPVRVMLTLASVAAGLPGPIDGPTMDMINTTTCATDVAAARAAGCRGKLCIHPRQVPIVNDGFKPTAAEVEAASAVLAAAREHFGQGAFHLDGRVIDRPVILAAERTLATAGQMRI